MWASLCIFMYKADDESHISTRHFRATVLLNWPLWKSLHMNHGILTASLSSEKKKKKRNTKRSKLPHRTQNQSRRSFLCRHTRQFTRCRGGPYWVTQYPQIGFIKSSLGQQLTWPVSLTTFITDLMKTQGSLYVLHQESLTVRVDRWKFH